MSVGHSPDRLQGLTQILYRLKSFFSQAQLHYCHTLFLQKKQHSITIFKSNVIHHGYTVVAVLRGNHLIKEHGSKVGGLYFTEGKENSTNKTIQNYTSHKWIREATGPTGKFDYALNSKDQSKTWVPSLKLKIFISPVESALSKLCVALHGSVCSNRHSWHIRLATLSKSHLHRFICDDLLNSFVSERSMSQDTLYIIKKASPKTTSSASNTCDKIKQKRKK